MKRPLAKNILLIVTLMCPWFVHAAYQRNVPVTVVQPDKMVIHCFATGDEYYNYLHDAAGYTILQHPQTGYYMYAIKGDVEPVCSQYAVGTVDPSKVGLTPRVTISAEEWKQRRKTWESGMSQTIGPEKALHYTERNKGTLNNIVIFIRFADDAEITQGFAGVDSMFNSSSSGVVSMHNYYLSQSYGQLEINTTFYPAPQGNTIISYQDSMPRSYFMPYNAATNPNGYSTTNNSDSRKIREYGLIKRAVDYIESNHMVPSNINLDMNNDGYVDNICFVVKGNVGAWGELLWPHRWTLSSVATSINGKSVLDYNFIQEEETNHYFSVAVLSHEMFHSLGAPDLYHYSGEGQGYPVGRWDIMCVDDDDSMQHSMAYMKWKYGNWIDHIPEITTNGTYTLNPLSDAANTNNCYKISTSDPTQWYVLEYRNQNGEFENYLSGTGLLVYRINTTLNGNSQFDGSTIFDEIYVFRPGSTHDTILGSILNAHLSTAAGRGSFTPTSNPHPFLQGGLADNRVSITNIIDNGTSLTFTCSFAYDLDVFQEEIASGQTLRFRLVHDTTYMMGELDEMMISTSAVITEMVSTNGHPSITIPTYVQHDGTIYPIKGLAKRCFKNQTGLRRVTFESAPLESLIVSQEAFSGCAGLTYVEISPAVSYLGNDVFAYCNPDTLYFNSSLNSRLNKNYWGNVKHLIVGIGASTVPDIAFYQADSLELVDIQCGVSIGYGAFNSCANLKRIDFLPATIHGNEGDGGGFNITFSNTIGNSAFSNCESLEYVRIPHNIKNIGSNVFSNCSIDTLVFESPDIKRQLKKSVFGNVKVLRIASGIDSIPPSAFSSDTLLTTLELGHIAPNYDIISIDEELNTPPQFSQQSSTPSLTIGSHAFYGCKALNSIVWGGDSINIDYYAFNSCSSLERLELPAGVKSIGSYAFAFDTLISYLNFSEGLDSIASHAFKNCKSLPSRVDLPNSLKAIESFAFQGSDSIRVVSMGGGISHSGSSVFGNSVDTVIVYSVNPPIINNYFFSNPKPRVVLVPCVSQQSYQTDPWWGSFENVSSYDDCQFTVTVSSNVSASGMVNGGGVYAYGDTAVISAIANEGYWFASWNDGDMNPTRTVVVTCDTNFQANFVALHVVHDTIVVVPDTLVVTDTMVAIDTLIVMEYVHDTVFQTITDYIHDTVTHMITEYIHDTVTQIVTEHVIDSIILTDTITTVEYIEVPVHDTTVVTLIDTIVVIDTLSVTEYVEIPIHDTTIITFIDTVNLIVHDTITAYDTTLIMLTDTVSLTIHDTTVVTVFDTVTLHDTIVPLQHILSLTSSHADRGVVVGGGIYYDGQEVEIAAIANYEQGYEFSRWSDGNTDKIRRITMVSSMSLQAEFVDVQGVELPDFLNIRITTVGCSVYITGAEGHSICIYDAIGRMVATTLHAKGEQSFEMPASGAYSILVDGRIFKKITVIK